MCGLVGVPCSLVSGVRAACRVRARSTGRSGGARWRTIPGDPFDVDRACEAGAPCCRWRRCSRSSRTSRECTGTYWVSNGETSHVGEITRHLSPCAPCQVAGSDHSTPRRRAVAPGERPGTRKSRMDCRHRQDDVHSNLSHGGGYENWFRRGFSARTRDTVLLCCFGSSVRFPLSATTAR